MKVQIPRGYLQKTPKVFETLKAACKNAAPNISECFALFNIIIFIRELIDIANAPQIKVKTTETIFEY